MQENHGLYVNRTEPIHLMTEVTSVLGSTIKIRQDKNRYPALFVMVIYAVDKSPNKLYHEGGMITKIGWCCNWA